MGRASRKLAEWLDGRELTDVLLSEYLQKLYNEGFIAINDCGCGRGGELASGVRGYAEGRWQGYD